jgi:hypothetical protein
MPTRRPEGDRSDQYEEGCGGEDAMDEGGEQASGGIRLGRVKEMAREGWRKVRNFLYGIRLVVENETGRVLVREGDVEMEKKNLKSQRSCCLGVLRGGGEGVEVAMKMLYAEDSVSLGSSGSFSTAIGFGFLKT